MLVGVCLYNIFDILEIFLKEHCGRPNLIESDALQGLLFFNVICICYGVLEGFRSYIL